MVRSIRLLLIITGTVAAFTNPINTKGCSRCKMAMLDYDEMDTFDQVFSRRDLFAKSAGAMAFATILSNANVDAASAKSGAPTKAELDRIKTGYDRLDYLLKNWDEVTTTCRDNGGECKRDAEPVRGYLGLRSTTDPLFQIEKVFDKVKYMDDIDDLEVFFSASEEWTSAVTMSNSMAFISQFGEYNPSGGKEEVLKYLNESKKQVIIAESSLKQIIGVLNL